MCELRGGGGGGGRDSGSRIPLPLENHKYIWFLSNTGPDPLIFTKLLSQHSMLGHNRPARETPFKWRFAGWLMMTPLLVVFGYPHHLKKKKKKCCQSWDHCSDKTFWICAYMTPWYVQWTILDLLQDFRFMVGPGQCPMISEYGPSLSQAVGPVDPSFLVVKNLTLIKMFIFQWVYRKYM